MTGRTEEQPQRAAERVRVAYQVHQGDSTVSRELPFVIGVLGDFRAAGVRSKRWEEREFQAIDPTKFDQVIDSMRPRLRIELPSRSKHLAVDLEFRRLVDFHPERI